MSAPTATSPRDVVRDDKTLRLLGWFARFDSPTTSYFLLSVLVTALVGMGLVMVLSASTVKSLELHGSPYTIFRNQALYALVGAIGLMLAARLPARTWRLVALPVLLLGLALQALIFLGLGSASGVERQGNLNWLALGPITLQPSEIIKLGLVLAGAAILAAKGQLLARAGHIVVPYLLPLAALSLGLVMRGHDLGTAIVLAAIVAGALFAAGVPLRYFTLAAGLIGAAALYFVITSSNRIARLNVWLGHDTDIYGLYRQPLHGRYALADGGWIGLGLGASREKWNWLPEAHNDFIFAIIGEELGLAGTWVVLGLFMMVAYACYRVARNSSDAFVRIAAAGFLSWFTIQALVNIGSVIGLLPVIGLPLPLVSAGGSSLIVTMIGFGVLLSLARDEPGCREALSARPGLVARTVAVVPRRGALRSDT